MKARDVMSPVGVLRADDAAENLARAFQRPTRRAVAVISAEGKLLGLVTDEDVLYALRPPDVRDDPVLARVYEEDADWQLRRRLEGQLVGNIVDIRGREQILVGPDDALVEVITVMARTGGPAVLVAEDDLVFGVITVDDLLPALLAPRPS